MTFRLVTLMCAVLLLSLAAFGLLMAYYQDLVMAEVANTASAVGQATLWQLRGGAVGGVTDEDLLLWRGEGPSEPESAISPEIRASRVLVAHVHAVGGDHPAGAAEVPRPEFEYLIKVEEVRAESDPAKGLVLTIPTLRPPTAAGREGGSVEFFEYDTTGDPAFRASALTRQQDIRLPIPVREYDTLYKTLRGRSLFLFLGVFVVGMVLSTGLAAHFTRPIRKLDAAIRRLSEGDLDVSVPVHGRDEIGRLSRAFNEMAGQLRANRDRAREMVRREKLSALGRMAAGVAHDVRNPLHSIGLTLEHLRETSRPVDGARAEEFDRAVEIIRGEIRRLDRLIGNFLSFAKSERHERVPVDLAALLSETAQLVQKEAERRGVALRLDLDQAAPVVRADGEALRSSILNLVLNSFEAMPGGGELTLRLRVEAGEALLEVTDTGEGIPEGERERVFEFAYTTRDGGNGLGLAMVHHCVVEEHGGRVWLESRPGEGTRVRLALPLGEAAPA